MEQEYHVTIDALDSLTCAAELALLAIHYEHFPPHGLVLE